MATIQHFHPLNLNEYDYWPDAAAVGEDGNVPICAIRDQIMSFIYSMALFHDHLGTFNTPIDIGDGRTRQTSALFDIGLSLDMRFGNATTQSGDPGGISFYYTAGTSDGIYGAPNTMYRGTYNNIPISDNLNNFKLTTYEATNTNMFWFSCSAKMTTKFVITKVVNVNDPTNVKYFPLFTVYDDRAQLSLDQVSMINPASNIACQCRLYDGSTMKILYDEARFANGWSNAYVLRNYISGEWRFPDLFIIEGGAIPVFNTDLKIKYGNDYYYYLTNRMLIKDDTVVE